MSESLKKKQKRNIFRAIFTIDVVAYLALAFVLFYYAWDIPNIIPHVHRTVGNGILTLGTFGYCLDVSNKKTCTHGFLHDPEFLAQLNMSPNITIAPFATNIAAISTTLVTLIFFSLGNRVTSYHKRVTSFFIFRIGAAIGTLLAIVRFGLDCRFLGYPRRPDVGFFLSCACIPTLFILAVYGHIELRVWENLAKKARADHEKESAAWQKQERKERKERDAERERENKELMQERKREKEKRDKEREEERKIAMKLHEEDTRKCLGDAVYNEMKARKAKGAAG